MFETLSTSETMVRRSLGAAFNLVTVLGGLAVWARSGVARSLFMDAATNPAHLRFIENSGIGGAGSATIIYATTDSFSSYTTLGPVNIGLSGVGISRRVTEMCTYPNQASYDMIIFGAGGQVLANPHSIFAATSAGILSPIGRSGLNCATSPYTGAIPYTCQGPAGRGIQPFKLETVE